MHFLEGFLAKQNAFFNKYKIWDHHWRDFKLLLYEIPNCKTTVRYRHNMH